jgi:hypothetical protein
MPRSDELLGEQQSARHRGAGFLGSVVVARSLGEEFDIVWDTSKLDGQPRRCLDVSKAERLFGFRARTTFEDGLQRTIDWQLQQRLGSSG